MILNKLKLITTTREKGTQEKKKREKREKREKQESYYITLMRYIEANALRAGLVNSAEAYMYASLYERLHHNRFLLHQPYMDLDNEWLQYVSTPLAVHELDTIRNSVNRQSPLGELDWQVEKASKLGLMATLNPRGRPKKRSEDD